MRIRLIIFVILLSGWLPLSAFDTYFEALAAGQKAERQKQFHIALEHYKKTETLARNYHEKYNSIFRQAETLRQNKQWDEAREALCRTGKVREPGRKTWFPTGGK